MQSPSSSPSKSHKRSTSPSPSSVPVSTEPVKTLYITGLPYDIKEREIQLLCRPYPGFEFCNLNLRYDAPSAFAKFSTREAAESALQALQGFQFDLNQPELLIRVDFAKSDTMRKTVSLEYYEDVYWDAKRRRTGRNSIGADSSYYRYYNPTDPYYAMATAGREYHKAHYDPYGYGYYHPVSSANTLYVGNLPPGCTDEDLSQIFRNLSGFKSLRLATLKTRQVIAFVTFTDHSHCAYALSQTTGTRIRNNTLRIEFAQESNKTS
jgi:hypothetical protein